jgi:ribosomal protein L11 methyltransferase
MPALKAAAGTALVDISTTETADDWNESWRQFHKPVLVAAPQERSGAVRAVPALRVRPPWEPALASTGAGVREIVIDPGQAFGTGAHATTRQCLELLLALARCEAPLGPLADVGTGSGVLARAAALLGFSPVLAIDHEPESITAARANAAVNGVELELRQADLRAERPLPGFCAQEISGLAVVANLVAPLLVELAEALPGAPSHLVAGGLLPEQVGEVLDVFRARLGLRERERREDSGWVAVWLCPG